MQRCLLNACRTGLGTSNRVNTTLSKPYAFVLRRSHTTTGDYESKYAEKLRRRAQELIQTMQGLSVEQLKIRTKAEQEEQARLKREALASSQKSVKLDSGNIASKSAAPSTTSPAANVRKDSSPVKPLSSILNTQRIMSTPHTADQISALWTAYHVSRSGGTGRGYVCAAVPSDLYKKMATVAERYPTFVVTLPRMKGPTEPQLEGEEDTAYEFYFLQWDFHDVPAIPSATDDPFDILDPKAQIKNSNPATSTILFTPLQEYKMRGAFATPYLVLTHYTDFSSTHGTVLLRGEITPASASGGAAADGRYMLNQEDAQSLSMAVQKFYLWGGENRQEGERLLKCFHESPADFNWEDLLKHANWNV